MNIKRIDLVKFTMVDTDIGYFRVNANGDVDVWDQKLCRYRHVTEAEYEINDIFAIRLAAFF